MNYKEKLYSAYVKSGQSRLSDIQWQKKDPYVEYVISSHITDRIDALIVDLGCGYGKYIYRLKEKGYTNCKGVDISAEQVEAAHKAGVYEIEQGELLTFIKKQPDDIDVVLLMDIIEHLTYQEIFDLIDEVKKKLSGTGKIILHVPNAEGIFGMRIRYGDLTHEVSFTPSSINQLFNTMGFKKIFIVEDKPLIYSISSLFRRMVWEFTTLRYRLMLMAETGEKRFILSQNMLVIAEK